MDIVSGELTVFFEDPFWVGVFKRIEDGKISVSKVTFGAEPKDYEVYEFILKHYYRLAFSPAVVAVVKEPKKNPKRRRRDIRKQLTCEGVGTKSQQALKLQQEQSKQKCKIRSREQRLAKSERLFVLKQQKKKDKHRAH